MKPVLTLALLLFLVCCVVAAEAGAGEVPLWGRWERSFTAAGDAPETLALRVRLSSPGGKIHLVDGFWDGDRNWRVRFMPDEPGRWAWRTSAGPAVAGLHAQYGTFQCIRAPSPSGRFARHGAVRVSADRRHLEHADGTPFFWLGDTVWNGALLSAAKDWDLFLAKRARQGYTAAQMVMTQWRTAPHDEVGQVAFTGRESIRLNPRFFQRLDARLDALNRHGLLAVPVLLWAIRGDENPGSFLPEGEAVRLARYMVARYGAHHVAWILPGDGNYSGETAERWKRIGRAVFDSPHAPTLIHPGGMQWPYDAFRDEAWLDLAGYQSGHGDDASTLRWIHSGPPARAWSEPPTRPLLNLEPPYEEHVAYQSRRPHSAYNVRRAVWWSLLCAPPAGVTYGGHGVWSWETKPNVPLNHANSGIARPWFEAVDLPGGVQMGRVADLFASLPWWKLRPAPDLVEQPAPDDPARFVGAASTEDGAVAILYCPRGPRVVVRRPGRGEWFDPRTGARRPALREGDVFRLPDAQAPDEEDWVLVLRRE